MAMDALEIQQTEGSTGTVILALSRSRRGVRAVVPQYESVEAAERQLGANAAHSSGVVFGLSGLSVVAG